jgi:hypothetical protein
MEAQVPHALKHAPKAEHSPSLDLPFSWWI